MTTRDRMVGLLASQMSKCDLALTIEGKELQELQLLGMHKMLYEVVTPEDYKLIISDAEAKARN